MSFAPTRAEATRSSRPRSSSKRSPRTATYALSGSTAAVRYLGGHNTVSDLGRRIAYTTRPLTQADFPEADEVIILTEDPVAARTWKSGYTSLAQTYADLWASPGRQAAEFLRALKARLFATADWEQRTIA